MSKNTNLSFLTDYITADITNGRIGINNASPTVAFDVVGVAKFSSSVTAGSSLTGTNTIFRTNDATGYGIGIGYVAGSYGYITSQNASSPIVLAIDGVEKMRITSGGNVGIGTSSPQSGLGSGLTIDGASYAPLYLSNSGTQRGYFTGYSGGLIINASSGTLSLNNGGANVLIGSATDTGQGHILQVTGAGRFTSSITASLANFNNLGTGIVYSSGGILTSTNPSDKRLKKDIKEISYGLSDILKLKPVSYSWKDDKINQGIQFGFIAQEVQEIMPDAIKEFGDDIKYLGLEKDAIYATLVNAIKELSTEINLLKNK